MSITKKSIKYSFNNKIDLNLILTIDEKIDDLNEK
jgi:hypothetical protein